MNTDLLEILHDFLSLYWYVAFPIIVIQFIVLFYGWQVLKIDTLYLEFVSRLNKLLVYGYRINTITKNDYSLKYEFKNYVHEDIIVEYVYKKSTITITIEEDSELKTYEYIFDMYGLGMKKILLEKMISRIINNKMGVCVTSKPQFAYSYYRCS